MGMDVYGSMLHEILLSQNFGCLKNSVSPAAVMCQIPMTKPQFPNNIQSSNSNDQEILIFFEFWRLRFSSLFNDWPACAKPRLAGRRQVFGIWCFIAPLTF
jgi:hypothetical protein